MTKKLSKVGIFKEMPFGKFTFNYFLMPKKVDKITDETTKKINAMAKFLEREGYSKIIRSPSKGISTSSRFPSFDFRTVGRSGFELTVLSLEGCFRYRLSNNQDENGNPLKLSGRIAFVIMRDEFKHDKIDIESYAVENGKEIKETIEPPMIEVARESYCDLTFDNVNHADFHSAYPGALIDAHPEFRKTIERVYHQRNRPKQGTKLKIALDASIGYFQSQYCHINGKGYALANLSKEAIEGNNEKMRNLKKELEESGRVILLYNTDGIWYKGKPLEKGRDFGHKIGCWENDHVNCRIRIKSSGSYEYIENGEYHPVVRGSTSLDIKKPREKWQWGDIYKIGDMILYSLDEKTGMIRKKKGEIK